MSFVAKSYEQYVGPGIGWGLCVRASAARLVGDIPNGEAARDVRLAALSAIRNALGDADLRGAILEAGGGIAEGLAEEEAQQEFVVTLVNRALRHSEEWRLKLERLFEQVRDIGVLIAFVDVVALVGIDVFNGAWESARTA